MFVNFTVKIVLVKSRTHKDIGSVYFQFTQSRVPHKHSLGYKVKISNWKGMNSKWIHELGTNRHPSGRKINLHLNAVLLKAKNLKQKYKMNDEFIAYHRFKRELMGDKKKDIPKTFNSLFELFIEHLNKQGLAEGTLKNYRTFKVDMNRYKVQDFRILEIDEFFVIDFLDFLRKSGNAPNTLIKKKVKLKSFLEFCQKKGEKIEIDFIDEIKLRKEDIRREFLPVIQLKKLESFYGSNEISHGKKSVLRYFLFCCETGMDFNDIKKFSSSSLVNIDGVLVIDKKRGKGNKMYHVPVTEKSLSYIQDSITEQGLVFEELLHTDIQIFNVISAKNTNRYLREIALTIKLEINAISFHVARHTFATNALNKGMTLEAVAKTMGHTSTRMTKRYARLLRENILEQFKLLNNR